MKPIARVGDKCFGNCSVHGAQEGYIVSGSDDCYMNEKQIARVGDRVLANCGHDGYIVEGAPTTYFNNKNVARLDDRFEGTYTGTIVEIIGESTGY